MSGQKRVPLACPNEEESRGAERRRAHLETEAEQALGRWADALKRTCKQSVAAELDTAPGQRGNEGPRERE
jgi:hypothetical protein